MTKLQPLRYEPGMTLGDFQAMIAAGDTRYQHHVDTTTPRRRPAVTTPEPPPAHLAWREKMDELRAELRRVKGRLTTAEKRAERCKQLHSTTECPHPFDVDAITLRVQRHTNGAVVRIGFTCPNCQHHVDLPAKLARL